MDLCNGKSVESVWLNLKKGTIEIEKSQRRMVRNKDSFS